MALPTPPAAYSAADQSSLRQAIDRLFNACFRRDRDMILPAAVRLVLTSPDGTLYALSVADDGTLSTVAYP